MAAQKKQEEKVSASEKPAEVKPSAPVQAVPDKEEVKTAEPVVTSTTAAPEAVENIKVVPEPQGVPPAGTPVTSDPLGDFKEKVNEELNMPDIPQKKNYMWPILLIFIIAIVLLVGIFVYKQGMLKKVTINIAPTASPTPTIMVKPTQAVVDLSKYEIEILNGSEVTGEASRQKANLEAAGFTISSVGNADTSDYTDTIIKAKTDVDSNFIAKLKSVLSNTFTVGTVQPLSSDAAVPVEVILGTQK
jgi:hypothetical protein